jgi:CheY-like chemotaxis protein
MPGLSGYELCRSMRQDPELAGIPVLLLTGTFETFDERRAAEVGASGHIAKPFEAQALIDRVHALLAEAANAPQAPPTLDTPSRLEAPEPDQHEREQREPMAPSSIAPSWKEQDVVEDDAPAVRPLQTPSGTPSSPPLDPPWSEASEISVEDLRVEPPAEHSVGSSLGETPEPVLSTREPSAAEPVLGETTFPPVPRTEPAPEPESDLDDSWSSNVEEGLRFAEPEAAPPSESPESTRVFPSSYAGADSIDEPGRDEPKSDSILDSALDSALESVLVEPRPEPPVPAGEPEARSGFPEEDLEGDEPDLPWAEALEEESLGTPPGSDRELPEADALFEDSLRFADDLDGSAPTLDPEVSITRAAEEPPPPTDSPQLESLADGWPEAAEEPAPEAAPSPKETEDPTKKASAEALDPEVVRQTLEKVAWEAFGSLSQEVVQEIVRKVEQIAWDVIPQLAERLILEEIARLKADPPAE